MSVKEKIAMMVTVVGLMLAVMVLGRLSSDALGMLIGVCVGLSVAVPGLALMAWVAGKNYAEGRERPVKEQGTWRALQCRQAPPTLRASDLEDARYPEALPHQSSYPSPQARRSPIRRRQLPPEVDAVLPPPRNRHDAPEDVYWQDDPGYIPHDIDDGYPDIDAPDADEAEMW